MLSSLNIVIASRSFHTLGKGVVINDYYLKGLGLSKKLSEMKVFLTRKRNPYNQHMDLGPEQLQFNIFTEFFANDARSDLKFKFWGFATKISAIIFVITFVFTFRSILLSFIRFMINMKKNYGGNSENYVKRVDNKRKIRDEFQKRARRVANKKYGEPKLHNYLISDDATASHNQYVNTLDHHTFSHYKLNDPVYDSTDYVKDFHDDEIKVRSEFHDFVKEQENKRKENDLVEGFNEDY